MCGIAGFVRPSCDGMPEDEMENVVGRMADRLVHRGPDGRGHWVDSQAGVALGHRRLSILDLSSAGQQPMVSASGRYVLVYNGEIYNFRALRSRLEGLGHRFRGGSDTEVMLAGIDQWGLESSLLQYSGMFAFALWDRASAVLTLARDRMGEKPLYYAHLPNGGLAFGSELKALVAHPDFQGRLDRQALALFLRLSYIPAPHSIYEQAHKVEPATFLQFDCRQSPRLLRRETYWSAYSSVTRTTRPYTDEEAEEGLLELLRESTRSRLESDVPLGAFLSGGIDSSLIVALAQEQRGAPIKTFCMGFGDEGVNEAPYARAVAAHLESDHHEHTLNAHDALALIPRLPHLYDEPFADSSQIATHMLCLQARQQVTVSLSGDGGDELFCGYTRYFRMFERWASILKVPAPVRLSLIELRKKTALWQALERLWGSFRRCLPWSLQARFPRYRTWKSLESVCYADLQSNYRAMTATYARTCELLIYPEEPPTLFDQKST